MRVMVVNAGSSSLKLRVVDERDKLVAALDLARPPADALGEALDDFVEQAPPFDAVGHRVVHGGTEYEHPFVIDAGAEAHLDALAALAPLHNPPALAAIHELRRRRPGLPQVACFDTSFHASMPPKAATYAVPARWRDEWGIRRFGFHGLSHSWASRRAAHLLGQPVSAARVVTAHLGAGASLAAVDGGRSLDTTMGFTPIEGLVMATRSGTLDPGAVLWALRHGGVDVDAVEDDLERRSGLLGLSRRSGDLRDVLAGADAGDGPCALAYEVFVYRIQTSVASMAVALGSVDALVFTGGAGEASGRLRADVCRGLGLLGFGVPDPEEGSGDRMDPGSDRVVWSRPAGPSVIVVHAREDLEIARHVREVLGPVLGHGAAGAGEVPGPRS